MKSKEMQTLVANLETQGWKVTRNRKHYIAYPPNKNFSPVTISGSPSDHRAYKNIVSFCRARGAKL